MIDETESTFVKVKRYFGAAAHELRCWECRVTWTSWFQRRLRMKRGFSPKVAARA